MKRRGSIVKGFRGTLTEGGGEGGERERTRKQIVANKQQNSLSPASTLPALPLPQMFSCPPLPSSSSPPPPSSSSSSSQSPS